jgi:hypothetical protein
MIKKVIQYKIGGGYASNSILGTFQLYNLRNLSPGPELGSRRALNTRGGGSMCLCHCASSNLFMSLTELKIF